MGVDTLKLYLSERVMAGRWNCHEQTYRGKWKEVVGAIASLRGEKIKFDPSDFPEDQIFLLTVDGVNFSICEPRVKNPGSQWYDHKSHSAGLTYLVTVDVRKSRICWIDIFFLPSCFLNFVIFGIVFLATLNVTFQLPPN